MKSKSLASITFPELKSNLTELGEKKVWERIKKNIKYILSVTDA